MASGLYPARMLGENGDYVNQRGGLDTRDSLTTFIQADLDPRLLAIQQRIAALTGMTTDLLQESEFFQIGYYGVGGHYNSHYDSSVTARDDFMNRPCCHNTQLPHSVSKCIVCRYMTVLMYLNDVEEGGETAFPVADTYGVNINDSHVNLNKYCHDSTVVIKPRKGSAVMWYNNYRDPQTGWIGTFDPYSLHGGCPVLKGEKWISNVWVSASRYDQRYDNSIYTERWT